MSEDDNLTAVSGLLDAPYRNCPFYGYHLTPAAALTVTPARPFWLIAQLGNQCAIVVDAYSPCSLEMENKPVEWKDCPRVAKLRLDLHD